MKHVYVEVLDDGQVVSQDIWQFDPTDEQAMALLSIIFVHRLTGEEITQNGVPL